MAGPRPRRRGRSDGGRAFPPRAAALTLLLAAIPAASAFILPGTYPSQYRRGQVLHADVASLISADSDLQYEYHALPICHEAHVAEEEEEEGEGRKKHRRPPASAPPAPYSFSVMTDARTASACAPRTAAPALTPATAADLASKIRAHYRVRLSLDGLPALVAAGGSDAGEPARPGYDLGFVRNGTAYVNNHLLFRVRAHRVASSGSGGGSGGHGLGRKAGPAGGDGPPPPPSTATAVPPDAWLIVGFDVLACSIARPAGGPPWTDTPCAVGPGGAPPDPQPVAPGVAIPYTYDVFWEASPAGPSARWDAYLGRPGGAGGGSLLARAHWLALANAGAALAALGAAVGGILARTVRRDVARYRALSGRGGSAAALPPPAFFEAAGFSPAKDDDGAPLADGGWRAVAGDVFRAPPAAAALAARFGSGVQLGLALAATLAGAAAGTVSPRARAALPAIAACALLAGSAAGGAASVWLWGAATRSHGGWVPVAWRAGAHFPAPALAALAVLNFVLHRAGAAGALPPSTLAALAGGWAITGLPLALLGGAAASRRPPLSPPTRTNQIPRHVPPPPSWAARPALLAATAGLLPFGACLLEARNAASAAWQGYSYAAFTFAAATAAAATAIVALAAVVTVYAQLCAEDYRWWWASHGRGGAGVWFGALYCGGVGLAGLPALLKASGGVSGQVAAGVALYTTYCGLGLWAAHLAGGAVGLGSALVFVRALFVAVKAD